jgi:plasminogen activator inhibitor 1 RNA-binding protein
LVHTGNDPEEDSDREPEPPIKVVEKAGPRHGKRDVPTQPRAGNVVNARGGRGVRFAGNELGSGLLTLPDALQSCLVQLYLRQLISDFLYLAFRDRNAGAQNNRAKPTDEITRDVKNRDFRGNRVRDDRHSRTDRV